MTKTTEQITISLKIPLKQTLQQLAEAEKRNISNMAAVLIDEAIRNRG